MASGRRLAAVMSADVVGFSTRMEADETGALAALKRCRREAIDPSVARSGGRIVKDTGDGDGVLAEFYIGSVLVKPVGTGALVAAVLQALVGR